MNEYSFQRVSESNVDDLSSIYKDAFAKERKIDEFKQKQNTKVFGDSYVGFIAYDEQNNPAAFYGVYPCKIEYQGKYYLAAQSGDTMTHSAHTGKGLFTQLAQKTYAYCQENGFHLVFGFPNENSFPGFVNRLGWSHFDDLTPYLIRVKCIPWIRLKNAFRLPQSIHDRWCRFNLKKLTKGSPFKSSCLASEIPVVDHSTEFFKYKTYAENYLINIHGINVWLKLDDRFLIIGDIDKCSETEFNNTIYALKKIAFKMGLPHLRFHTSSNTWGENMFKKQGFPMEVKYPVGGINFTSIIPLEKLKFTGADNDTF
jgi:GNAT superfamily N-acetyltransferase